MTLQEVTISTYRAYPRFNFENSDIIISQLLMGIIHSILEL